MTEPTMNELLRVLAGKGTVERPAEPETDAAISGSADGGRLGEPVRLTPSMNDVLRAAYSIAKQRRYEG